MAQIDRDAVLPDCHTLDQKVDDAGLLCRIQRRPELIELADRRDDRLLVDGPAFLPEGLDRSGGSLGCADHAPNLPDDGVLDHACG